MKVFFFTNLPFHRIWRVDQVEHWSKNRIKGNWPILGRIYIALGLHHTDRRKS